MIQGGGFTLSDGRMTEKPTGKGIKNEGQNGLKNERGTIAMARTPVLDSATSQFFINVVDNPMLNYPSNGGYAVFGKVIEGMDVVDKIKAMETTADPRSGEKSTPVKPVVIVSATVE
jgi:cyclophilin family peptidyl-prolyl cis-trans isomerase